MKDFTLPEILTDNERLTEVYKLRTIAWADLPSPTPINTETFPDGFKDPLDEKGVHWVANDADGDMIAAARVAVLNSLEELPYWKIFERFELPAARPFLLYSHRCTMPEYRDVARLRFAFDTVRMQYQRDHNISFAIATAYSHRHLPLPLFGWKKLGDIEPGSDENYFFGHDRAMILKLEDMHLPEEP